MLLDDMLRHTPTDHADHSLLTQALSKVDEVAVRIDKGLHEYEQQQRLLEISAGKSFVRLSSVVRKY